MVPSGFRRIAHLCFINQFSKKCHNLASTASDRKVAKIWQYISWFFPKKYVFQNIKIMLNSRIWMTLKSSAVIFQVLEPLQAYCPQWPLQPLWPHWPLQPYFIKGHPDHDGWIISGIEIIKTGPFLWSEPSKIYFLLISDTLAVGIYWGQLMLLFWKLVDKTQMSKPPKATRHHSSSKFSILLPLRAI